MRIGYMPYKFKIKENSEFEQWLGFGIFFAVRLQIRKDDLAKIPAGI